MIGEIKLKKINDEYGDYQTPHAFVELVCQYLKNEEKINPKFVLEPTFGLGSFVMGAINEFKESLTHVFGVEINTDYYNHTRDLIEKSKNYKNIEQVDLYNEDIFTFDFNKVKEQISQQDKLLIVGNPPWVTNSYLAGMDSNNLPVKKNFKGLKGLDAITGMGNFDIAEYIVLQMLSEFKNYNCTVAMLCKNIVAKNIVYDLGKYDFSLSNIKMLLFNATDVFGVSCEASLLVLDLGAGNKKTCDVYDIKKPDKINRVFGWVNNNFISDVTNYSMGSHIDGISPIEWRQGVKHDSAKVMELSIVDGVLVNGHNEELKIERDLIYPLLKSSDLKKYIIKETRKQVLITQRKIKEPTDYIEIQYPKTWEYLNSYREILEGRKSSIYKKSPPFSIFGVGEYSFMPYKVAVSGFYKEPIFSLVYGEKTIMLDDTCYFLGFNDFNFALITMLLLNHPDVQGFIKSIAFLDSKRPYTKKVLMRIDLLKVVRSIEYEQLIFLSKKLDVKNDIDSSVYKSYIKYLESCNKDNSV